jgi:hypothetical protein
MAHCKVWAEPSVLERGSCHLHRGPLLGSEGHAERSDVQTRQGAQGNTTVRRPGDLGPEIRSGELCTPVGLEVQSSFHEQLRKVGWTYVQQEGTKMK